MKFFGRFGVIGMLFQCKVRLAAVQNWVLFHFFPFKKSATKEVVVFFQ